MPRVATNEPAALEGALFLDRLLRYIERNRTRLLTPNPFLFPNRAARTYSVLGQLRTISTLGLDPNSQPLNPRLSRVVSLGLASPTRPSTGITGSKHLVFAIAADRLLFLLLLFKATPSLCNSPHLGDIDQPLPDIVQGVTGSDLLQAPIEAETSTLNSWVGTLLSTTPASRSKQSRWFGGNEALDEDSKLRLVYSCFTTLPSVRVHRPLQSQPQIQELVQGGRRAFRRCHIKVPLDVFRSLCEWVTVRFRSGMLLTRTVHNRLELDGYDPRAVIIPSLPKERSKWPRLDRRAPRRRRSGFSSPSTLLSDP